jgi:hypothetical protein
MIEEISFKNAALELHSSQERNQENVQNFLQEANKTSSRLQSNPLPALNPQTIEKEREI